MGHWTKDKRKWKFDSGAMEADEAREEAFRFIRADYYSDVTSAAMDLMERARDGDIEDYDDFDQALHEAIDGNRRVFVTYLAKLGLIASDNEDIAEDEGMETGGPEGRMFFAMRQDVMERIEAAGFDPQDEESWADWKKD